MKTALRRIDRILGRVPADSATGRRIHGEIVDHLEQSIADEVDRGTSYEAALERAVDQFGDSEALERDYYRDYVATRYRLGLIDREALSLPRLLRRLGAFLFIASLLLYLLLPTVAIHVGVLSVSTAWLNDLDGTADDARRSMTAAVEYALPPSLDPRIGDFRPWSVLAAIGFSLFAIFGAWSLKRLRLQVGLSDVLVGCAIAAFGAVSLVVTADPEVYAAVFVDTLFDTSPYGPDAPDLSLQTLVARIGAGLVVAVALWVFWRAQQSGVADTYLLRRGAIWLGIAAISLLGLSHGTLQEAILQLRNRPDGLPPAQLYGALRADLSWFVLGSLGLVLATWKIDTLFADADRIATARAE